MKEVIHIITLEQKTGEFPLDMLRYDGCWPESEKDAGLIRDTMEPGGTKITPLMVKVRARKSIHWEPTAARWESFGWRVIRHDKIEY